MFPEGRALEFLIVAIVALMVVGPKDLPVLLRKLGQFMAKLRGMAAEFRASFDEMARQSELDELRKEVEAMRNSQYAATAALEAPLASLSDDLHASLSDPTPATTYGGGEPGAVDDVPGPEPVQKPKVTRARAAPKAKTAAAPRKPAAQTPANTSAKPRARKTPEAGA